MTQLPVKKKSGGQPGNQNGTGLQKHLYRGRAGRALWLRLHEKGIDENGNPKRLNDVMEALIMCAVGDPDADPPIRPEGWAIKEILDRIDGKAAQAIEVENVNETRTLDAAEQAGRIKELFMTAAKVKKRKSVDLDFEDLDV